MGCHYKGEMRRAKQKNARRSGRAGRQLAKLVFAANLFSQLRRLSATCFHWHGEYVSGVDGLLI
jgi:hypothetical protein